MYIPVYAGHLRCGKVLGQAVPVVEHPRPGAIRVDAGHGFAHAGIDAGWPDFAGAVRAQGVAAMTRHRSYNIGVLGHHAERLAEDGLPGLCFTNAPASIAPTGGKLPVIRTNPVALSVPDGAGGARLIIDQSASAVALTEIIARQDLPAGLFNLVMGPGRAGGQRLAENPRIDAISFTGSVPVGRGIAAAAIGNMTRLQMEMGSKNPMVICDDCDLDLAVTHAVGAAFGGTGQKCTAASRLIVQDAVHDAFVEKLVAAAEALKVGHALEDGTQIGPVVSDAHLRGNLDYLRIGQDEGAELICGGGRPERATDGYFMAPAVLAGTTTTMRVNREEMFAPVTCILRAGSYDEALHIANDTEFGLMAGIMTRDLARATHFRRNARAGCVMVNLPTAGTDYHVPFGGRGASSYGPREQGRYAEEFYTTVKTADIRSGPPA